MNKQKLYLQSIRRAYPDLQISSVACNDQGQYNDVLIINAELIFRFPRYAHGLKSLQLESAILSGIQAFVPLDVPHPAYINLKDQAVGEAFMGYRMIPGEPLWSETLQAIDDAATLDALAAQLAGFLRALHCVSFDQAIACELPVSDTRQECLDIYTRMREKLFPHMRPDARRWASDHFETFMDDAGNFDYQPVLKHGDFGTSNIVFDPRTQTIKGIIDFGGSCLGDPAYDLAGMLSGYGEIFVRRCFKTYPEIESFLDRVHFYRGTFALLEALFGIENDDPRAFESGIQEYV
jgi:aminoglycoside 2''-phosphotransferase